MSKKPARKAKAAAAAPSRHARARARVQAPVVRGDSTPVGVRGDTDFLCHLYCDHCGEPTTEIRLSPAFGIEAETLMFRLLAMIESVLCAVCTEQREAGAGYEEIDDDIETTEDDMTE